MTGRSHQLIGLVGAVGTVTWGLPPHYAPAALAAFLLAAHFGALVPDIDSGAADVWEHVPFGGVASKAAGTFLSHRNFTHSLLGLALIGGLTWYLVRFSPSYWGLEPQLLWTGLMIGYAAHLLADMMTVEGIPLFWPWQRMLGLPPKPLDGIRIVSGGWFEQLVLFPILNLILIGILWTHWPVFQTWLFR